MEDSRMAATAPDAGVPEALQVPTQPVRLGFMLAITIASMTYFLCYIGVGTLSLPFQISQLAPASKVTVLSLFAGTSVLVGLVTNPLAGAFSDRTTSRFGRRRPWIFTGALGTAVSLFIMWQAISLPLLYIGWCGVQLFSNFAIPAIVTTIPDQVPERQRGAVSGVFGLALPLEAILGAILIGQVFKAAPANAYLVILVVVLVINIPFALFLSDKALPKGYLPAFRLGAFLKGFWINPRRYPDFGWAWLTRFIPLIGYFMGTTYILYYLQDAVKYPSPVQGASTFTIVTTVVVIVSTLLGGFLSDRLGRRKLFVMLSVCLLAIAMLLLAFFHTWQFVLLAAAFLGVGFGAYIAVDVAITTLVLPSAEGRGKDLGIINIASTLPQSLAPVLAGVILGVSHSYTLLYVGAAVFVLLGILVVQPIKVVR